MKIIFKSLLLILLFAVMFMLSSCKDDGASADAKTRNLLQAKWRVKKVTVDGVDQTVLFAFMKLAVYSDTYASEHGEPEWPTSGTWELTGSNTMTRGNDFPMTIETLDERRLILSFTWTRNVYFAGGLRGQTSSGNHVFEFERE